MTHLIKSHTQSAIDPLSPTHTIILSIFLHFKQFKPPEKKKYCYNVVASGPNNCKVYLLLSMTFNLRRWNLAEPCTISRTFTMSLSCSYTKPWSLAILWHSTIVDEVISLWSKTILTDFCQKILNIHDSSLPPPHQRVYHWCTSMWTLSIILKIDSACQQCNSQRRQHTRFCHI